MGAKLCEELVRRGYTVTALDVQFGSTVLKNPWIKNIKVRREREVSYNFNYLSRRRGYCRRV